MVRGAVAAQTVRVVPQQRHAVPDIVTPTAQERRLDRIRERQRRYALLMVPCVALVAVGLLVPLPPTARALVLAAALVLGGAAAVVANTGRGR